MKQTISNDGTPIAFWQSGSGSPLLLVHGTTADHSRWAPALPSLEQHFTVYGMDRRGRGGSGDAPAYDLLREAEDVAAVVEVIGGPVDVIGHSYGGLCSLEATLVTENIRRLVLYEPPLPGSGELYPAGVPDQIQALIDEGELEAGLELFFRRIVRMPEHEFEVYREMPVWKRRIELAPTIAREVAFDRVYKFGPQRWATMTVPTLLLVGGDSSAAFRWGTEMVHQALPDSRVVVLPGQQHVAMDTAPELFLEEVLRFLGSEGVRE